MTKKISYSSFVALLMLSFEITAQCPITVDAGEDVYLCVPPTSTQLNGDISGPYLNFTWTPVTGLIGANTLTPSVLVSQTTTYVLTGKAVDYSQNSIFNGDFELGNVGFTSDYIESPGNLVPEGVYEVLTNPQNSHPGFSPCGDHTSGSGNMMAVNGAGTPNVNVWCQTITVQPNTEYAFTAWVATLVAASPALLQFSINGQTIGSIFSAPPQTCVWKQFNATWNSAGNSSATICIVNQNTALSGNDFALDDIGFSPLCTVTDTVVAHVVNITAVAAPPVMIMPCEGASVTLSGVGSSVGNNITYQWESVNGNFVSGENTLTPVVNAPGLYTLHVVFDNGFIMCEKTATVNVIVTPNPILAWILPPSPLGCGSPTLTLIGNSSQSGFSSYEWTTLDGNIVGATDLKNCVVDAAGSYSLLVTNTATGCTATAEVTVVEATNPPIAAALATDTISCVVLQSELSGSGSSTGAGISYAWTATSGGMLLSGANQQNAIAGAPGTYILTVTSASNGCTASDTTVVVANNQLPVIGIAPPDTLNCVTDSLLVTSMVNPANATLQWTALNGGNILGATNGNQINVDAPGDYAVVATNVSNGCTAADTVAVVLDIAAPLAMAAASDTITCQQPAVQLSGAGSSLGYPFAYAWTEGPGANIVTGANTLQPTVNAAGTYTLQVTNTANGCTAQAIAMVVADTNAVNAVANALDTLSCLQIQTALSSNGSSNGAAIVYAWTTSNGNIVSGADSPNPVVDAPGDYNLQITNSVNGCSATDVAILLQNINTPVLAAAAPTELTCANPSQTLQVVNNGPAGNYQYSWSTANGGNIVSGANTLTPLVNAAGTYTLSAILPSSGCVDTLTLQVVLQAGTPLVSIQTPDTLDCNQTTLSLQATNSSTGPDFVFSWSVANGGHIAAGANTLTPLVDAPGTYILQITNSATGCVTADSVLVAGNFIPPPADAGLDGLLTCFDPIFTLSANAGTPVNGLVFSWSVLQNGNLLGNADSSQVNCDASGLYLLLVTNTWNGCIAFDTLAVQANQSLPSLQLATADTLDCVQATVSLSATGNGTGNMLLYDWSTADGSIVSGNTSANPEVDAPGLYTLTVTDSDNGCTTVQSVPVMQDTLPPGLLVDSVPVISCAQPDVVLESASQPNTGITVQWSTLDGNLVSGANTLMPTANASGTYTLQVTNTANGCSSVLQVILEADVAPPSVEAGVQDTLDCSVTAVALNGSGVGQGNLSYFWTASAGGNILTGNTTSTPQVNTPGWYILQITDDENGCMAADSVLIVNDANAPFAAAGNTDTLNCAVLQLQLMGMGSMGPDFTYAWTSTGGNVLSGANTLNPSIDAPGNYQLMVTNTLNGCTAVSSVQISQDLAAPMVSAGIDQLLTCSVSALGLSGTGSAPGNSLSYSWTTINGNIVSGANTATPMINQSGSYQLTLTNLLNGCTATDAALVTWDTIAPIGSIAAPDTLNCVVSSLSLSSMLLSPAGNFSLLWTTNSGNIASGANTSAPLVDAPGLYTLMIQDLSNGCTSTLSTLVPENTVNPTAQVNAAATLTCAQPVISLDALGSSSGAGFSYQWTVNGSGNILSGATTLQPQVSAAGSYSLQVTDQNNGCTAVAQVLVPVDSVAPIIVLQNPAVLTCVVDSIILFASANTGSAPQLIAWSSIGGHIQAGENTLTPLVDAVGQYVLTVTNQVNGCFATAALMVAENTTPPLADAGLPLLLHCLQPQTTLAGSASAGSQLLWSASNGGHIVSGGTTSMPLVDEAGAYTLLVTNNSNGCTATDVVQVDAVPLPSFVPEAVQPDCHTLQGAVSINAITGGAPPFSYSIDGGAHYQNASWFNGLAPDQYNVVLQDAYGCTASEVVVINQPFLPTLVLPQWVVVDFADSVRLQPLTNIPGPLVQSWTWTPSEGLSCTDCASPFAKPFQLTTYNLVVSDLNGCTASARVVVQVKKERNVYAPNVFHQIMMVSMTDLQFLEKGYK
ncbi:MAG: hypothetical protein IPL65_10085 [Lewinellaceae bacterium]|nr:hypothetical protein [Lewinellaceae bacterium]